MDIQLTLKNESQDVNNSTILVFQKNVATTYDEIAVAWQVIKDCGVGDSHPFTYHVEPQEETTDGNGNAADPNKKPIFHFHAKLWIGAASGIEEGSVINSAVQFDVEAVDSEGNTMPRQTASMGDMFEVVMAPSGHIIRKGSKPASSPSEVEVKNNLSPGAISANIYKEGKLLTGQKSVLPGQKAVFNSSSKSPAGAAPGTDEGRVMNSAVIQSINTELNLIGISSADIVMTGGGSGADASPFEFSLQNVKQ